MLIGADDDRNSSAVWLTQHKLAEAQCVGKYVPIAPLTFAISLRSATLDFGEWVCVRVRTPCLLACLSCARGSCKLKHVGATLGKLLVRRFLFGRLYTSEYLWASMVPTVVVCDAVRLHVRMRA